mgnify:CR=1 FL=1
MKLKLVKTQSMKQLKGISENTKNIYAVLKDGFAASDALADDIRSFVRARLSAHEYPREIAFVGELPLTTSGKVIRRLLRDQA